MPMHRSDIYCSYIVLATNSMLSILIHILRIAYTRTKPSFLLSCYSPNYYETEKFDIDNYSKEESTFPESFRIAFPKIIENIECIWKHDAIRRCSEEYRGQLFYITDNMDYWYDFQLSLVFAETRRIKLLCLRMMSNIKGINERGMCIQSTGSA
eukprot:1004539_1